jgi:hypothetical protein
MLFALAALLWLPVSAHCLNKCVTAAGPARTCHCPVCQTLRSGGYEANPVPSPENAPVAHSDWLASEIVSARFPAEQISLLAGANRPALSRCESWQFGHRAALPPRAPSFNS